MKLMSSILVRSLIVVLTGGIAATIAQNMAAAQTITVTVPFAFSAGSQDFPAGTYRLSMQSEWLLSVRNLKTGGENIFPVHPEQEDRSEQRGCLRFRSFGGRSYLAGVYVPGTNRYGELNNGIHAASTAEARLCSPGASRLASSKMMAGK